MAEQVIPICVDLDVSESINSYCLTAETLMDDAVLSSAQAIIEVPSKDYNELLNKPSINNVVLIGNKTLEDFIADFLLLDCGTSTTVI